VSREAFEAAWIEKKKKPLWRRIVKVAFLFGLFSSACVLGCVFGTYMAVRQNLPLVSELEEWEPNIITYIYSDDGEVIMQYAVEKRIEVPYEEIPDIMKKAILATEDPRFFSHKGIDFFGILRAIRVDISNKLKGKTSRLHGGSTISQQLARELFLHRRQTIRRKLKEAILSLQIEKRYSKQEIFAMYCNQSLVLSVEEGEASVQVKDYVGKLTNEKISWTKTENLKDLIKEGDVIHVKIKEIDGEKKELLVSLDQEPILEGAFLAIEPLTGQIKAMVGGYSFKRSEWNNATQAMRQAGSAIKPILYAAAFDTRLFTPASIINDEPTTFIDKWSGKPWSPPNYDGRYKGAVTVRKGLEESRNIVTAKLLDFISPQKGAEYCRKFGITSQVYPFLSLSLGAFELRLVELVSAFTTFPNKGIRIKPYFISRIEDKDGNILEESKIEAEEVISPQIAYMMTSLLQGVVQNPGGTGWRARRLNWPLGGKTGTTDDYADAWFIGFSPSLCAGVWVGHGARIPIGERQSGAVAAQPIWVDFFEKVIRDKKQKMEGEEEFIVEEFEIPPNLSFVEIDRKTGLLANPFVCLFTINEVFLPGTEPKRYCTYEDHLMILDYYEIRRQEQR